jgi:hypothetical protein
MTTYNIEITAGDLDTITKALEAFYFSHEADGIQMFKVARALAEGDTHPLFADGEQGMVAAQGLARHHEVMADNAYRILMDLAKVSGSAYC